MAHSWCSRTSSKEDRAEDKANKETNGKRTAILAKTIIIQYYVVEEKGSRVLWKVNHVYRIKNKILLLKLDRNSVSLNEQWIWLIVHACTRSIDCSKHPVKTGLILKTILQQSFKSSLMTNTDLEFHLNMPYHLKTHFKALVLSRTSLVHTNVLPIMMSIMRAVV